MPGLSRLFAPREREFFDLFEEAGRNIVQAATCSSGRSTAGPTTVSSPARS